MKKMKRRETHPTRRPAPALPPIPSDTVEGTPPPKPCSRSVRKTLARAGGKGEKAS